MLCLRGRHAVANRARTKMFRQCPAVAFMRLFIEVVWRVSKFIGQDLSIGDTHAPRRPSAFPLTRWGAWGRDPNPIPTAAPTFPADAATSILCWSSALCASANVLTVGAMAKTKREERLVIRLAGPLLTSLKAAAERDCRPLSSFVRKILIDAITTDLGEGDRNLHEKPIQT